MDHRILLGTWGVLLALVSIADARKWTDAAGNVVSAEYVRIHEGEVILRQGTRLLKCPYDQFSDLDKAFIRDQMEADREKSRRRSGLNQIGGPVAPEVKDDDAKELRTWRDLQGKKILAQYTGFSREEVELIKDGKRFSYPYFGFSGADQMYVAQILTAEGRADEIPKKKQDGQEESGGPAGTPTGNSRGESDYGESDVARASGSMGGGNTPSGSDYEVSTRSGNPRNEREDNGGPDYTSQDMGGYPNQPGPMSHSPSINHQMPSHSPSMPSHSPSMPRGNSSSGMQQQMVGICSNCNKEVPSHIGAGDRCPHCNVYFEVEEGSDGKLRNSSGKVVSRWAVGGGGVGIVVFLLAFAFRLFVGRGR